jgi:DNA-binding NtrC family response regulator
VWEVKSLREARAEFEREYIHQLLIETGGNRAEAARIAGVNRTYFFKLLLRAGVPRIRNDIEGKRAWLEH